MAAVPGSDVASVIEEMLGTDGYLTWSVIVIFAFGMAILRLVTFPFWFTMIQQGFERISSGGDGDSVDRMINILILTLVLLGVNHMFGFVEIDSVSDFVISLGTIWATLYEGVPRILEMVERSWGTGFLDEGFADRLNISLNILELPGPDSARLFKMRTLHELDMEDVFPSKFIRETVVDASKEACDDGDQDHPFIVLQNVTGNVQNLDNVHRRMCDQLKNLISSKFSNAFVAEAIGVPTREAWFVFGLTYEKRAFAKAANRKFRLLLMRREQLENLCAVETDPILRKKLGQDYTIQGGKANVYGTHRVEHLCKLLHFFTKPQPDVKLILGQVSLAVQVAIQPNPLAGALPARECISRGGTPPAGFSPPDDQSTVEAKSPLSSPPQSVRRSTRARSGSVKKFQIGVV